MKVEDNTFLNLETKKGQVAWLHVSWTEWKNLFSFEIYGRRGKLQAEGLGGSYGLERLTYYKMLPSLGPPLMRCFEFPSGDDSWRLELRAFERDICSRRKPNPGLEEALSVIRQVEAVYQKRGVR